MGRWGQGVWLGEGAKHPGAVEGAGQRGGGKDR